MECEKQQDKKGLSSGEQIERKLSMQIRREEE